MTTPQTPYAPKMGTLVNLNRVLVPSKAQASLSVAVRVRPILKSEQAGNNKRDIIRVLDGKIVVVLDPDEIKDYLDQVQNRTKEKKYTFDVAYDTKARNSDVYAGSIRELAAGVSKGLNGTVFAYGATGSGKTHTMVGTPADPGLMVLSLSQIFQEKAAHADTGEEFTVTCSYLEVYNEVIYDLLVKNSGPLELREDPDQGICVAGLKHMNVTSAAEIMGLLEGGNRRRKTDSTDANAASSRSHAVLEIVVRRCARNQYHASVLIGKLTLVDLAGSERAAETNNAGQKLRDGANINKSLLALANCINALGKKQKTGVAYVPYRNSKLTRLLKDSLRGNSRTAMVATIGAAADQYHHSVNTLKYADRAKEIKTHVVQNVGTVERHITDYQNIIDNLQNEVQSLKSRLAGNLPARLSASSVNDTIAAAAAAVSTAAGGSTTTGAGVPSALVAGTDIISGAAAAVGGAEADTLAWIDALAQEINDNVEERINLQKALFELEDINVCNKYELQNIDDMLKATDTSQNPEDAAEASERRTVLLEEIEANNLEAGQCRADIATNEACRRDIQAKIEKAIDANNNVNFLKILSTFRIQAVRLQELKFQMAVRDQIISEQRDVISNLWQILGASGLTRQQVVDIAHAEGIVLQGVEQNDLSSTGVGGLPAVGASCVSALGSLPLTSSNGGAHTSSTGTTPTETPVSLPAAAAAAAAVSAAGGGSMQQSLMGGKARYRYKFWQQYKGVDTASNSGTSSPLQSLRAPLLLQAPPHTHRARAVAASSSSSSSVTALPALNLHQSIDQPPRSMSPLRSRTQHQQQQQHRQLPRRTGDTGSPEPSQAAGDVVVGAAAHIAAAGSTIAGGGMKRYTLQPMQQSHQGSTADNMRRQSHSSTGQLEADGAGPASITVAHSKAAIASSSRSNRMLGNPYDPGSGLAPGGGRRRHHGSRQKELPPPVPSISTPAHPGLPGQQRQLEHTIQALRRARQQQAAGKPEVQSGTQQQQQQQQAHVPHRHSGMLAWQEVAPGGLSAQQVKQVEQIQREKQLSLVYGSNPLGDKLAKLKKRNNKQKFSSAGVSAEHSYAELTIECSAASAYSAPTAVATASGAGAGNLPSISEGSKPLEVLRRKNAIQQLQTLWQNRRSHH